MPKEVPVSRNVFDTVIFAAVVIVLIIWVVKRGGGKDNDPQPVPSPKVTATISATR